MRTSNLLTPTPASFLPTPTREPQHKSAYIQRYATAYHPLMQRMIGSPLVALEGRAVDASPGLD